MQKPEMALRELLAQADIEVGGSNPWDIQVHNPRFLRAGAARCLPWFG